MSERDGKFYIVFADGRAAAIDSDQDRVLLGRLDTCDVVLDHPTVSRIHAAINFLESRYFLVNLSSANPLTLNGRLLEPQEDDVLAAGDTIQLGPFAILVEGVDDAISLIVQEQVTDRVPVT